MWEGQIPCGKRLVDAAEGNRDESICVYGYL